MFAFPLFYICMCGWSCGRRKGSSLSLSLMWRPTLQQPPPKTLLRPSSLRGRAARAVLRGRSRSVEAAIQTHVRTYVLPSGVVVTSGARRSKGRKKKRLSKCTHTIYEGPVWFIYRPRIISAGGESKAKVAHSSTLSLSLLNHLLRLRTGIMMDRPY